MKQYKKIETKHISFEESINNLDSFLITHKEGTLYKFILASIEKPLIESILEKTGGNQLQAAHILGINRNTLYSKIKKLGIDVKKWKRH